MSTSLQLKNERREIWAEPRALALERPARQSTLVISDAAVRHLLKHYVIASVCMTMNQILLSLILYSLLLISF